MIEVRELYLDHGRMFSDARFCVTDTKNPVFSWSCVSDTDSDRQTAYRAQVTMGKFSLWDSGWVESEEQSAKYDGKNLPAGRYLDFCVRVRNVRGEESDAFGGQFVCGALTADAWKGKWISSCEDNGRRAIYFRRDFRMEKELDAACLFVSGIGYHHVTVNGMDADDAVMDPAFSDYNKTCYYAVLPNVGELLENGDNCIGITVANGWRNNDDVTITAVNGGTEPEIFGKPALNAQLMLFYKDGTKQCLCTDSRWKYKFGAVTEAHIFDGETYNADESDPLWDQPLDEGERAAAADTYSDATEDFNAPHGILRPMALEPIRMRETYSPIAMTEPVRGTYIVDFGQNIAGVARVLLPARMKRGQTVTVRFSEELDENGFLYTETLRSAKQTDTYIASGDDRDLTVWQPHFTYHGFRYAEVKGLPLFDRHNILAIAQYNDIKNESFFRCGSPIVNAIQDMVIKTEKSNLHSVLTDCPQRNERMAWLNDATVRFEETPYNFDIGRIFPKVIRDIRDAQNDAGAFCCCSPRISFGGIPADPVCSSYLVAGMQAYLHTGNREILAESFDGFAAWEDCLLANSTDYIVGYSYYGDWAGPDYACAAPEDAHSAVTDGILMSTGYSYYNCVLLAKMAEILARPADAEKYAKLAAKIRDAFLAKWWHDDTATVDTGSQGAQAFALWLGILPENRRGAAAEVLHSDLVEKNYQFTTGNLCTRYAMDVLTEYGYLSDAWKLITKDTYPSFGYMLENEATTVWERFELKKAGGMNSHNHPMYGAVGYWFYAYLCGIKPVDAGYRRVTVKPYYPEGLLSAQCALDTVKGQIAVRWSKRYGKTQLSAAIPFGVTAEITVEDEVVVCGSGTHNFEF